jgi:hypothetical protein
VASDRGPRPAPILGAGVAHDHVLVVAVIGAAVVGSYAEPHKAVPARFTALVSGVARVVELGANEVVPANVVGARERKRVRRAVIRSVHAARRVVWRVQIVRDPGSRIEDVSCNARGENASAAPAITHAAGPNFRTRIDMSFASFGTFEQVPQYAQQSLISLAQ